MEGDVKALINLKEGTIQLEGSQTFVEKYLDRYSPFIEKWQQPTPTQKDTKNKVESEKKREEVKKTRTASKSGCSERVRTLIDENYFSEPRTNNDVTTWLKDQKSVTYQPNQVAAALSNLIKTGKIRRFKEGGVYKYCNV